jgi:putative alpha-1,2-mannosidase
VRGRDGNDTYTTLGYIGHLDTRDRSVNDQRRSLSATLEYTVADCALSAMAQATGRTTEAAILRQRAQAYRNLWDSSVVSEGFAGFPRARYVFSTLGFVPSQSGSAEYLLNAPRFTKATIQLEDGHTLTIKAPGPTAACSTSPG